MPSAHTAIARLTTVLVGVLATLAGVFATSQPALATTFESGHVRPLALSADGSRLFAVNTPDGRLEILSTEADVLTLVDSVAVGLAPVAVAVRSDSEVWVVNHLSDSVSIVDVSTTPAHVVRTLLVGDEPRDIVFAGLRDTSGAFTRAFITTARRGQNLPTGIEPKLTTPGKGRALVWVFDAGDPGPALGGEPETIIELFGDTPRALAVTLNGGTVYAAVFHSGNQTTAISEGAVEPPLSDAALRAVALVDGQELTYTCVPPGKGLRFGLDRDGDGLFDRDEIDASTDPADPNDPGEPSNCVGDCDGSGAISVDEIITGIAIALGERVLDACLSFDVNGDGQVTVDEIVTAVSAALAGCGGSLPSPLPDLLFSPFQEPRLNFSCAEDILYGDPQLSLCVTNNGMAPAGQFEITAEGHLQWEVASLDTGAEACFAGPLGSSVRVRIDPSDVVRETDESNNDRLVFLPTITRGPACTPTPPP